MPGKLYIVATPIGNLEDITLRALRILREADLIACEDTRYTQRLLNHFDIKTKTLSYHEHNETRRANELCALMESGKNLALVSDAGTPLVNDPGFQVVQAAIQRQIPIVPVPGPAAFVAALAASGLATDQFLFAGFLPSRSAARRARLQELSGVRATLTFYEAPHRMAATLRDAADVFGARDAVVAREITKIHEEFIRGTLIKLAESFAEPQRARGEMVLLISGDQGGKIPLETEAKSTSVRLGERVRELEKEGADTKAALKLAARELNLKRDEAYRLMELQKNRRSK